MGVAGNPPEPVQALRWWSAGQLHEIDALVEQVATEWMRGWSLGAGPVHARSALAWETRPADLATSERFGSRGPSSAWVFGAMTQALGAAMFDTRSGSGAPARSPMACALAAKAAEDFLVGLRDAFELAASSEEVTPPGDLFRPWSGAVLVRVAIGSAGFELLLNGDAVTSLVRPVPTASSVKSPIVDAATACADSAVSLQVMLEGVELDLGTLSGLQVGDILPLPHALDRPLDVNFDGQRICHAFLGRRRNAVAVELLRNPAPSAT